MASASVEDCKSYLKMLLLTGYHDHTTPIVFRADLNKIKVECRGLARFTNALVASPGFNSFRFRDMQKLQSTVAADLVAMLPEDTSKLPW